MEETTRTEALALLDRAPVGHLGVVSGKQPYVAPLSYAMDGMTIYMRCAPGRRLEALRRTPTGCLEVTEINEETGAWSSAIAYGTVTEVFEDEDLARAIELLLGKYRKWISASTPGAPEVLPGLISTLKMEVESVTGRASGRWFGATRPGRL